MFRTVATRWTTEQVASLAPDASALKAGEGLASPRKWSGLGHDDGCVWGLAQGSGAQPYQVQIDLEGPAFKCTCPSRKFPCKHGLGLLLLLSTGTAEVPVGQRPRWVEEWVAKRMERAERAETKASAPPVAPDPAAQARRREKREALVGQGVEFLQGWLGDLARQGLSSATSKGYGFWDEPARRLIDAQAPGLARRVRALGGWIGDLPLHEERAMAELGRLFLLTTASQRRIQHSPEWQDELNTQLGLAVDQDSVRARAGVAGRWFIGAQVAREEEKLQTRMTYLFHERGAVAKILEFSHPTQRTVSPLALGRWIETEVVYFPGVQPLRALLKSPPRETTPVGLVAVERCDALPEAHASRLAENPFVEETPVVVRLRPCLHQGRWWVSDDTGASLPVSPGFALGWELLSSSGGTALTMTGTWDGFSFLPLGLLEGNTVVSLAPRMD